MEVQLTHS